MDEGEGGGPSCHMSGSDRLVGEQVEGCMARNGSPQVSTLHLEYSKWRV